jgi:hypothetical protein
MCVNLANTKRTPMLNRVTLIYVLGVLVCGLWVAKQNYDLGRRGNEWWLVSWAAGMTWFLWLLPYGWWRLKRALNKR